MNRQIVRFLLSIILVSGIMSHVTFAKKFKQPVGRINKGKTGEDLPGYFSIDKTARKKRVRKNKEKTDRLLAGIQPGQSRKKRKIQERKLRNPIRDMNFEELEMVKNKLVKRGDKEVAFKFIDSMIKKCTSLDGVHDLMLEAGDLLFDSKDLDKAEKMYLEFTKLYPGSKKVEYALYKSTLCSFYSTLGSDRDQTKTRDTLALTEKYINRSEIFTNYLDDVKTIARQCNEKLAHNEIYIADFYLKKGTDLSNKAAKKRLDFVRSDYLEKAPNVEAHLLALEYRFAEATNSTVEANTKLTELKTKYPKKGGLILADNKRAQQRLIRREERKEQQLQQLATQQQRPVNQSQKPIKFVQKF